MAIETPQAERGRSKAWIYYTLIAIAGVIVGFSTPLAFLVAVLAGLYAYYLYQGGSIVVWFW